MSGQLVGEVLAASEQLRARGLSKRGFHALIAIAEKAITETREGSVRWDHIRAAIYGGASLRTAERAIQDLKRADVIIVARPGFNNNHGTARAPIYKILQLTDPDTQVAESVGGDPAKFIKRSRQDRHRSRHPGVGLDGSLDGSLDEAAARAHIRRAIDDCAACDQYGRDIYGPVVDCPKHLNFRKTFSA